MRASSENFAANILNGEPLIAPGVEGINGVRLANAIYLSSWKSAEVSLDFDDDEYLSGLNRRIAAEGQVSDPVARLVPARNVSPRDPVACPCEDCAIGGG